MSETNSLCRNSSRVMVCKYGEKARFIVAKSENNQGRIYYEYPNFKQDNACDSFRWVSIDGELYAETSATADALAISKLQMQKRMLEKKVEDCKLEILSLQDENNLLRRMVLGEYIGGHGMVIDGELVFRSKDMVVEDLHRALASLKAYKLLLFVTWVGFALYWAIYRM